MHEFVGRRSELAWLKSRFKIPSASFIVIRGRRRIGKSRLIYEFCKDLPHYIITGLPPAKGVSRRGQLDRFCSEVARLFDIPEFKVRDWGEAFAFLSKLCGKERLVLALDEISWIGSKDPTFLGHLKNAWDQHFSRNPELILVVCGSVSSWIERNILSSTGFVGRITGTIDLQPLSLPESIQFWSTVNGKTSSYDILQMLAITGGVPRYLEAIDPTAPVAWNIKDLCFNPKGLLFNEFDQIFSDLFTKRAALMKDLLLALSEGSRSPKGLSELVGKPTTTVNDSLHDLLQAGFVSEEPTWSIRTTQISRLKKFRLSDNYVRFYLKCIRPVRTKVLKNTFEWAGLEELPNWASVIGLQFENLVVANIGALLPHLGLTMNDVEMYGPFFQRSTVKQKGCQIDLLIQTRHRTLYVCEVKFSRRSVGMNVAEEISRKVASIAVPRNFSTRTVLIHVNGVSSDLQRSRKIDYVLDFSAIAGLDS